MEILQNIFKELSVDFDWYLLLRLFVAALFGGIVGLERSKTRHEAGMRTHLILCLGAASVMVLSECLTKEYGNDISRFGAQVISGVGFLGAGNIIIDKDKVRGITTAAGIWTTACMGLVIGSGYYIIASLMLVIILFAATFLHKYSYNLRHARLRYRIMMNLDDRDSLRGVTALFAEREITILGINISETDKNTIEAQIELPAGMKPEELLLLLAELNSRIEAVPV